MAAKRSLELRGELIFECFQLHLFHIAAFNLKAITFWCFKLFQDDNIATPIVGSRGKPRDPS